MGFWDFVAPDLPTFRAVLDPVVPPVVMIGGVGVSHDQLITEAWLSPFSGAGLAARVYYTVATTGGTPTTGDSTHQAIQQHAAAAPGGQITVQGVTIMAQLIIANVYRCAIKMAAGGRDILNVVHVEGSSSGQESAAASAVLAAWKVANGPLTKLSSLVTMQDVTAMDLSSSSGGIHTVTDTTAGGISASNSLATRAASALIKINGGTRARTSRGRIYYGPIMEQDIGTDGATLDPTHKTTFGTAFAAFQTSLSGAGFTLGVASRATSVFTSAGSLSVESTIATQRRRIRS